MAKDGFISEEDYVEPNCPFCTPNTKPTLPVKRIIEKLDEYLYKKDFSGAKRHLDYWLTEADAIKDFYGKISVLNECVGFYRKTGNKELAEKYSVEVLSLVDELGYAKSLTGATAFLNVATALKSFGDYKKAIELYDKAQVIYEKFLPETDYRLGGLYNNKALALSDAGEYALSRVLFEKALYVMQKNDGFEGEIIITLCNLATLTETEKGFEEGKAEIEKYLKTGMEVFRKAKTEDGNFAYALEKCADAFGYYGFESFAKEMTEKARSIYERA
ncbi:MAG: tetratricopeptide repeat protein [Clostridia bacterium]|nr:tetratricopeptide repeat protein [Clostridia bacterium]